MNIYKLGFRALTVLEEVPHLLTGLYIFFFFFCFFFCFFCVYFVLICFFVLKEFLVLFLLLVLLLPRPLVVLSKSSFVNCGQSLLPRYFQFIFIFRYCFSHFTEECCFPLVSRCRPFNKIHQMTGAAQIIYDQIHLRIAWLKLNSQSGWLSKNGYFA